MIEAPSRLRAGHEAGRGWGSRPSSIAAVVPSERTKIVPSGVARRGARRRATGRARWCGLLRLCPHAHLRAVPGTTPAREAFLLARGSAASARDNEEAVAVGPEQTAGPIAAAGPILIGTFGSFVTGRLATIKEIGLDTAAGVPIDAAIVRVVLVPSAMRPAGATNWWLPPGTRGHPARTPRRVRPRFCASSCAPRHPRRARYTSPAAASAASDHRTAARTRIRIRSPAAMR